MFFLRALHDIIYQKKSCIIFSFTQKNICLLETQIGTTMPLNIQNLKNEIEKLNDQNIAIECKYDHHLKSLTLNVMSHGTIHLRAILAICNTLNTDDNLLSFSLNGVSIDDFDILIEFLADVLKTNRTIQILNINIAQIYISDKKFANLEVQINKTSKTLENAMKNNPHLRLGTFVFCVPVEYRERLYSKDYVVLSPIDDNESICSMLLKNTHTQHTSTYANNRSSYFSYDNKKKANQVAPIEYEITSEITEATESLCRCTIS